MLFEGAERKEIALWAILTKEPACRAGPRVALRGQAEKQEPQNYLQP
jgi:hypothetical protein